jgi:hypothetical protein
MGAPEPEDEPAYDPETDLARRWPEVRVVVEPMAGRLLGELRYPVIALRAGTSAAQRRCTLTHEIVHLERGTGDCGPWAAREEQLVQQEVARRLIPPGRLREALREAGGDADRRALARLLDVDLETLQVRLALLSPVERARLRGELARALGPAA